MSAQLGAIIFLLGLLLALHIFLQRKLKRLKNKFYVCVKPNMAYHQITHKADTLQDQIYTDTVQLTECTAASHTEAPIDFEYDYARPGNFSISSQIEASKAMARNRESVSNTNNLLPVEDYDYDYVNVDIDIHPMRPSPIQALQGPIYTNCIRVTVEPGNQ